MFKKGDRVKVVRQSPGSPTVHRMLGRVFVLEEIRGIGDWYIRGTDRVLWVCLEADLEHARPDKPLSPLECLIQTYVDEQRKELGIS